MKKEGMTDTEIAEAIIGFLSSVRWSSWVLLIGVINSIILLCAAYDYIFFDGGFDQLGKGFSMLGLAIIPLAAGAIMRDIGG